MSQEKDFRNHLRRIAAEAYAAQGRPCATVLQYGKLDDIIGAALELADADDLQTFLKEGKE